MIESPTIVQIAARPTAFIHVTTPRDRIQEVMGPGIQELISTVKGQGIAIVGPWFTHHLKMEPGMFDFEISVPVASPIAASGRVHPGEWPAMRVARAVHHGGYEGLAAAWPELKAWVGANGHQAAPDIYECYLVGPESGPDPSTYRTELNQPLLD